MNTEYLPSFLKDLKALKSTPVYDSIKTLAFETIPGCSSLAEVRNLAKLTGYETAYRIRIGDYRIGLFVERDTITFARVLHRKEIYRYFPW
ncbi:type II toxin-antitoxin system RelE family toxin [Leptodesmis sichuanensis]|uniref:type II toxin-antitoxin system RelE family toxin n=1 Tax=Leptodesmis sichuanensis TaxID=2906798 RepID=UPI001F30B3AE|nr:type II toxin-antitoxin system RelE/ParE family toxin [Leptodesmis sichuanensis]UIE39459.1 type II toxin-antitoxin system RelE/ParE family toxin [Leptodesmis sichuanensis A121]